MSDFYDKMAGLHHLIFQDWDESIERQSRQLASVIHARWKDASTILDVSCGIGTQAIGLAQNGFVVAASDLSEGAVTRARAESERRGVQIDFSVCDMRAAYARHQRQFDVVVSADNSITHLLNDSTDSFSSRCWLGVDRTESHSIPPRLKPRSIHHRRGPFVCSSSVRVSLALDEKIRVQVVHDCARICTNTANYFTSSIALSRSKL